MQGFSLMSHDINYSWNKRGKKVVNFRFSKDVAAWTTPCCVCARGISAEYENTGGKGRTPSMENNQRTKALLASQGQACAYNILFPWCLFVLLFLPSFTQ